MLPHSMVTKTYPLEVEEELWEEYKDTVPRSVNLDDPIIEFIEKRVDNSEEDGVQNDS